MSDFGVPVKEIGCLAGHATSGANEIVHLAPGAARHGKGALAMDQLFSATA